MHTFAASTATEAEERIAQAGKFADGSKPVQVPKRVWRPQVKNAYEEPETELDDDHEWLFQDLGKTVVKQKKDIEERSDLIFWDQEIYQEEFEKNIQWRDCPTDCQSIFEAIIKSKWDVFAKEGVKKHILGYAFSIDIGAHPPVCYKTPRYGPHESFQILKLIQ